MAFFRRLGIVPLRIPLALVAIALLGGCATAPTEPARRQWRVADLAYLRSPLEGAPGTLDPASTAELSAAYQALVEGYAERADRVARTLMAALDDATVPTVLLAQVELLRGEYATAVERLAPIVVRESDYDAARWALGRAQDGLGDAVAAYGTLAPLADSPTARGVARQRISELEPEVVTLLATRVDAAIAAGDFAAGGRAVEALARIAPQAPGTQEAVRALARAEGDEAAELAALRALSGGADFDSASRRRLADLELAQGEPAVAMRLYESLLAESAATGGAGAAEVQAELTEALGRAKFQWRLRLLPQPVVDLSRLPVLTRGDFAALTYWLVPSVRRGAPLRATIANDVLDHPWRDEIVRVVNLELMDVDPVHRFDPTRPVATVTVLRTFLEILARAGTADACVGPDRTRELGAAEVCAAAVRCALLAAGAECSPNVEISGARAVDLGRAALSQLGAP